MQSSFLQRNILATNNKTSIH